MKRDCAIFDGLIFPGGKMKAFTMSYDDGTIHDRRLVDIMNRHHIKGTFNLNSGFFSQKGVYHRGGKEVDISKIEEEEIISLYRGHEIAGHGLFHSSPTDIGESSFVYETIKDKDQLEKLSQSIVRGYAYPYGFYNETAKKILCHAGYRYARITETTGQFTLPVDFMEWKATCHHNEPRLIELAEEFIKDENKYMRQKLFYLWGHSYEFEMDNSWNRIEKFLTFIDENGENIWFGTNIEIYDYVMAYRKLEYSADANRIFNPSAHVIWLKRGNQIYVIEPLQEIVI